MIHIQPNPIKTELINGFMTHIATSTQDLTKNETIVLKRRCGMLIQPIRIGTSVTKIFSPRRPVSFARALRQPIFPLTALALWCLINLRFSNRSVATVVWYLSLGSFWIPQIFRTQELRRCQEPRCYQLATVDWQNLRYSFIPLGTSRQ